MALAKIFLKHYPKLKILLKQAHLKDSPEKFIKKASRFSVFIATTVAILLFFLFDKMGYSLAFIPIIFLGLLGLAFLFMLQTPSVYIRRRQREIDKEVLFAGRYLLIKMQSGTPFFNALTDAAKSYGVAGKYFKEIVDDINLGTPVEKALENATEYSSSEKFRKILWQVTNSLKTGINVSDTLETILNAIAREQITEIKAYGKKLSSMSLFYLLFAIVVPSLGMTVFVVISSFISVEIKLPYLIGVVGFLAFIQYMFLSMFKSIRPAVNL